MNQCLHITFLSKSTKKLLSDLQQKAREVSLEGSARIEGENNAIVVVCGSKEKINNFVDFLYQELAKKTIENLMIEPMLRGKDYRGIFRVIE
jgi:acylphosphatase